MSWQYCCSGRFRGGDPGEETENLPTHRPRPPPPPLSEGLDLPLCCFIAILCWGHYLVSLTRYKMLLYSSRKDIKQISSGNTNHNNFLVIFEGIAKFSSFDPCPSLPSFATDNRIHFQCLNIVLTLLSPDSDQDQISLSNIHTLSRDKLWELIKWSLKGKCLDLLPNSLNLFFNEMYRDQFGEFVCG